MIRGGNALRKAFLQPCPEFDSSAKDSGLKFSEDCENYVMALVKNDGGEFITMHQCFWLANLTLDMYGDFAKEIYEAIEVDNKGLIPMDNYNFVMNK